MGGNFSGTLGLDPNSQKTHIIRPIRVSNLTNIVTISSGKEHSLALKNDGTVWAWGSNFNGEIASQLGNSAEFTPLLVEGLPTIVSIVTGSNSSYAMGVDGSLWAWGKNAKILEDGSLLTTVIPSEIKNTSGENFLEPLALYSNGMLNIDKVSILNTTYTDIKLTLSGDGKWDLTDLKTSPVFLGETLISFSFYNNQLIIPYADVILDAEPLRFTDIMFQLKTNGRWALIRGTARKY